MKSNRGKSMSMTRLERSGAIDALRVLAIVCVIAGHVWDESAITAWIYPWHVPLFFVLSGYLWSPGRSLGTEFTNRWKTLGRPYVGWLAVLLPFFAVAVIQAGTLSEIWRPIYGGAVAGRPFSTFWFVSALFFTTLLYRFLERFSLWVQWFVALAGLCGGYLAGEYVGNLPLAAGSSFVFLVFLLSGRVLRVFSSRIWHPALLGIGLIIGGASLVSTGLSTPLDMKDTDLGVPVLGVMVAIAISVGLLLLAEICVPYLGSSFARTSTALASGGMFVVLAHPVVLWVLNTPPKGGFLDFLAAVALPWALALLVLRTPLSPWLLGVARSVSSRRNSAESAPKSAA